MAVTKIRKIIADHFLFSFLLSTQAAMQENIVSKASDTIVIIIGGEDIYSP